MSLPSLAKVYASLGSKTGMRPSDCAASRTVSYLSKSFHARARHYLDIFTKFVITQSFKTIIVVNPFLDRSMLVQLLVKAKRLGITVVIVTRPSFKPHIIRLHEWLSKAGIKLLYHKKFHAKIIIVDDALSIVSSMNFQYYASAGISWEAGIVTINKETVDSIKASIADLGLTHENS